MDSEREGKGNGNEKGNGGRKLKTERRKGREMGEHTSSFFLSNFNIKPGDWKQETGKWRVFGRNGNGNGKRGRWKGFGLEGEMKI